MVTPFVYVFHVFRAVAWWAYALCDGCTNEREKKKEERQKKREWQAERGEERSKKKRRKRAEEKGDEVAEK